MSKINSIAIRKPSLSESIQQVTRLLHSMTTLDTETLRNASHEIELALRPKAEEIEELNGAEESERMHKFIDAIMDLVGFAPDEEDTEVITNQLQAITAPNMFLDFDTVEGCKMWRGNTGMNLHEFSLVLGYSVATLEHFESGAMGDAASRPIYAAYRLHALLSAEQHLSKHLANTYAEQIKQDDPKFYDYLAKGEVITAEEQN